MRSNIARTWSSGSVPPREAATRSALISLPERAQEVDELGELLGVALAQCRERRHRGSRVEQRPSDRLLWQPRADLRELGTRAGVAVVADLVAPQAAGRRRDGLAGLEARRDAHLDRRRRSRHR